MSNGSKSRNSLVSFVRNYREAARKESMKQRRKQAFQPMLDDHLEERRLMAVSSFIDSGASTLFITSTAQENINIFMDTTNSMLINGIAIGGANSSDAFTNILINTTTTSDPRNINFGGNVQITGQTFSISNLTLTGTASSYTVNALTQSIRFGSTPTINFGASSVGVSGSGLINQALLLSASTACISVQPGTYTESVVINKSTTLTVGGQTSTPLNLVAPANSPIFSIGAGGSLNLVTPSSNTGTIFQTSISMSGSGANTTGIELNDGGVSYTDSEAANLSFTSSLTQAYKVAAGNLTINANRTNSGILVSGGSATINSGKNLTGNVTVTSGTFTNNGTITGSYTQSNGTGTNNGTITGAVDFSGGSLSLTPISVQSGLVGVTGGTLNINVTLANMTVGGSGTVNVQSSGNVSNSLSGQGGTLTIANGGRVSGLVMNGTTASSCGTIVGPVTVSAGSLTLNNTSTQVSDFTVAGGALNVNSTVNNLTTTGGTTTILGSGVIATSTAINNGTLNINSGGSVNALVENGSAAVISSCGTILGNPTFTLGTATLNAGSIQAGNISVSNATLNVGGDVVRVALSGSAGAVTVQSTGNVTTGFNGTAGTLTVDAGGVVSGLTVNGTTATVSGQIASLTALSNGTLNLLSNQTLNISARNSSTLNVNATVTGAVTSEDNSVVNINGVAGTVTGLLLSNGTGSGSQVNVLNGATVGNVTATTGDVTLDTGTTANVVTLNGDALIQSCGTVATLTAINGPGLIDVDGNITGLTTISGSANLTNHGQLTGGLTANGSGLIENHSTISGNTAISATAGFDNAAGTVANLVLSSTTPANFTGGSATLVDVQAGAGLLGNASASFGTVVVSGGTATLTGSSITAGANVTAGTLSTSGSIAGGLLVASGSTASILAGGSADTAVSNGTLNVNGTVSGATTVIGSTTTVQGSGILSGPVNANGGTLNILNGGSVSGLAVNTGSTVNSCGTILGNVTNIAGALTLNNTSTQAGNFSVETGGSLNVNSTVSGTLDVQNGTATVLASGNVTGLTTNANGSLTVNSGGSVATLNATGGTTAIQGTVTGTATVSGTASLSSSGSLQTVTVQSGTANLSGGTATSLSQSGGQVASAANITGSVSLTGGNTTITGIVGGATGVNGGNLTSNGSLQALSVFNGTAVLTGGTATSLIQQTGCISTVSSAANITGNVTLNSGNTTITGIVGGVTTVDAGNLSTTGATLNNVTLTTGTASLSGGTAGTITQTGGTLTTSTVAGGTLDITGGNATVTGGSIAGNTTVNSGSSTLVVTGGTLNNLTLTSGTANVSGGSVLGTTTTDATLNISSGTVAALTVNTGTTSVTGGTISGAINVNGGTASFNGTQSGTLTVNGATAGVTLLSPVSGLTTVALSNSTAINSSTGALTLNGANANVTIGSGTYTIGATSVIDSTLTVPANTTVGALTATNSTVTFNGAAASIVNNGTITLNGAVAGATTLNGGTANLTGGTYTGGIQLNAGSLQTNTNANFTGDINTVSANATTLILPTSGSVTQTGNLTLGANTTTDVVLYNSNGNPGGPAGLGTLASSGTVVLNGSVAMTAFNLGTGQFPTNTTNMPFLTASNVTGSFSNGSLTYQGAITFTLASTPTQAYLTNTTISGIYISPNINNTGDGNLTYFNVAGSNTTGVYGITAYQSLAEYGNSAYATAPVTLTLGNDTTGSLLANRTGADLSIYLKAIGSGNVTVQSNAPISLNLGDVVLNSGDTLNISFFGANTTITTDSLVVSGSTDITGANLALSNVGSLANTPLYTALTIIDQTTANVVGDFSGGIYNRTVDSKLFYGFTGYGAAGSSPRDVSFVYAPAQGTLTTVKVNDDWAGAGYANGTVINANEIIGINMAGSIGAGLSALATPTVAGNSSLVLYNGTYSGNLDLSAYTGANNLTVSVVPDSGSYGTVSLAAGSVTLASSVTLALDHGATSSDTDILQANGTVTLGGALAFSGSSVADYTVFQPVRTTNNSPIVSAFTNGAFGGYGTGSIAGYYVANSVTSQANPTDATTSVMSLIRVVNPGNLTNAYVSSTFTATNGQDYSLPNSPTNTVVYGGINAFSTIDQGMGNIADSTSSNLVISNAITSVASVNVTKSFDILFMNATGGSATGALQFGTLELNSNASPQLWDAGQVTANSIQLNEINGGTALGSYNVLGLATNNNAANITFGQPASYPGQTAFTTVAGSLIAQRSNANRLTIYGNDNNINASSGTGAILTFNASGGAILNVSQINLSACLTGNITGINANTAVSANALLELDDITILNLANRVYSTVPYAGNLTQGSGSLRLDITGSQLNDFFTVEGNITSANVPGMIAYSGFSSSSTIGTSGTRGSFIYNQATAGSLVLRGADGDDTFNFGSVVIGKQAPVNPAGTILDVLGGAGNDSVILTALGNSPSTITNYVGGTGNNTLKTIAPELFGDFQITGQNTGQLIFSTTSDFATDTGVPTSFSQVGYLVGSDNNGTASASVTFDRFVLSQIQPTAVDGETTTSIESIVGNPSASTTAPSYDQLILGANLTSAGSTNANLSTWAQWNIETLDNGQGDAVNFHKVAGNVQVFNNLTSGSTSAVAPVGTFLNVTKFIGGDQNDIYNVSGTGKVGIKLVDGGAGTNSLELGTWDNLASATVGATVDLRLGWATPINGGAVYSASSNSGLTNVNNVYGTNTNDTLYGNDLSNVLYGSSGNDSIYGYGGNDILIGDYGNDSLVGGNGNDFLTGDHVDFYFDITGADPAGVLPMEILLDVHQNGTANPWKTATTSPTTFGLQATALSAASASSTSNYGTMSVKGLTGVATANGTTDGSNANTTIFADYNLDTLSDTSGLNYLIATSGVRNAQTGLLDSTANDYVPTSTIVTRRRYSRWNPWS